MKQKYIKIIVAEKHNIERIMSIIARKEPKIMILESSSRMFNLKTQWIAQKLISEGWRENNVQLSYKGNLFKVILSKTSKDDNPEDAHDAKGILWPGKVGVDRVCGMRHNLK